MYLVKQTDVFSKWLKKLKDTRGKVSIIRRIARVTQGNFGDHKSVGDEVWELRLTTGPGYRIYYTKKDDEIVILLVGGDKSTQTEDISKAKLLLKEIQDD
jgi:putative addiction module killer protein